MNIKTATQILKRHNKWIRGDENIMEVEPKKLGVAIETIIDKLGNLGDTGDASETSNTKWYVEVVRGMGYLSKDGIIKPAIQINEGGVEKIVAPREDLYSR